MKLVLASQSEWRRELFSWLGVPFSVQPSAFDESLVQTTDPEELVTTLAVKKAQVVADQLAGRGFAVSRGSSPESERDTVFEQLVILAADTVIVTGEVAFGDRQVDILGKPRDLAHAREILRRLKGRSHIVYTGVAILDADSGEMVVELERTRVKFRDFSNEELEQYLKTGESLGSAGAYRVLGSAMKLIEGIEGSVTGVVGLPLRRTTAMLEQLGVVVPVDVRRVVEEKIGYPD